MRGPQQVRRTGNGTRFEHSNGVIVLLAVLTALIVMGSACGNETSPQARTPAEMSDNGRLIEITMTDNSFEPTLLEAKVGETVTLLFYNEGTVRHEAVVGDEAAQQAHVADMEALTGISQPSTTAPAQGIRRARMSNPAVFSRRSKAVPNAPSHPGHDAPNVVSVEPGETGQITYSFIQPTELLVGCHEPGHYEDGMVATLIVD